MDDVAERDRDWTAKYEATARNLNSVRSVWINPALTNVRDQAGNLIAANEFREEFYGVNYAVVTVEPRV